MASRRAARRRKNSPRSRRSSSSPHGTATPVLVRPKHTGYGGHLVSRRVELIAYVHEDDGEAYQHDFTHAGVELWANPDGSLEIRHPKYRLWEDVVVVE